MEEINQKDLQNFEEEQGFQNLKEKDNLITKLKNKKGFLGIVGIGLGFLVKFKVLAFLVLTKLKFLLVILKLSKFVSTILSMLFMIIVYAKMYGVAFGVGFVLLIFVHEIGHYLSSKLINLDTTLPIFIPFVGAFVSMKELPKDATTEAKLAIGGPILGSLGSLACFLLYFPLKQEFLLALAYTGFLMNLFNLMPLHPLDGGRVVSAISPKLWLIGIPLGIFAVVKAFNPIIVLLLILGIIQAISHWKNPDKSYYDVKPSTRAIFALIYFGLMCLLGIGTAYIYSIHLGAFEMVG